MARGNWLMFLDPAAILEEGWMRELRVFIEKAERLGFTEKRAATFKLGFEGFGLKPRLAQVAAATRHALVGLPRAEQGLLISKRLYQALGGHRDGRKAERRLVAAHRPAANGDAAGGGDRHGRRLNFAFQRFRPVEAERGEHEAPAENEKRHVPADIEIPSERKTDDIDGHARDQDREQRDAQRLRADAPNTSRPR